LCNGRRQNERSLAADEIPVAEATMQLLPTAVISAEAAGY